MLVDEKVGGSTFSNRTSLACSLCSLARSFLVRVNPKLSRRALERAEAGLLSRMLDWQTLKLGRPTRKKGCVHTRSNE